MYGDAFGCRGVSCTAVVLYRSCPAVALAKADLRSNARTIRKHRLLCASPRERFLLKQHPPGVPVLKKHLRNILIGSQLRSGPKARLYTSLGPSPQVPCPKNNQGLKARSNASVARLRKVSPQISSRRASLLCGSAHPVQKCIFML